MDKIRIQTLFLCILLLGFLLGACENVVLPEESEAEPEDQEQEQIDRLPDKQEYAGYNFIVAVTENSEGLFFNPESSESLVKTAVDTRNRLVTEKYGIIIETRMIKENEAEADIKTAAEAGEQYADLLCLSGEALVSLADGGLLYNLLESEDFDIEAKYVETENAINIAVNNALYMIYDSATQYYDDIWVVFCNRELVADAELTDPALLAETGLWTWQRFLDYSERIAYSVVNKGSPDLKTDIFGYASYHSDETLSLVMWESCGIPMFGDTYLQPVTVREELTAVNEAAALLKTVFNSKSRFPLQQNAAVEAFNEGRVAFFIHRLEYAAALESAEIEWCLLPLPMRSVEQEGYKSFTDTKAIAMAIPANVTDPQRSVVLMNAFCAASGEAMKKAVYNKYVNLFFQNNTSTVMLETVLDTAYFDMAALYGSRNKKVAEISVDVIVSAISSNGVIDRAIENLKDSFEKYSAEKFT